VLCEELAGYNMALSSCIGIHTDCVGPYLLDLANDEQQARWLPGFVTGEVVTAIAMTEPTGGSDLANLRTTAVADGDGWVLNGSKTFITNGSSADLVIVAARTGGLGARGISLFLVEASMPGFERGMVLDKVGQPESDTSELFFTDVQLSADHLLGEPGKGFTYMMQRLPQERMSAAVGNLAHAAVILDETIAYAKQRQAFGQPIGSFQHNKFLFADLVTRVDVTRSFVDQCVLAHAERRLSPVDAAKAKWWSAEVQNLVLDACVQLHGGYGYMTEERVARAWMDARVTKIWAGSNEIMKEVIGRDLGF
jgi:alkylation response protein AidB-like acyl-CoA dehydrogenase